MEVRQILRKLANSSLTKAEKGRKLEEFVKAYLMTDPAYAHDLEEVWTWDKWPDHEGHDTGIDLIAKTKDGKYWAIQSKFYGEDTEISKKDIDTFLAASGKTYNGISYDRRLFVSTTDKWSKTASKSLENQLIPVTRIGIQQLEAAPIDWNAFNEEHYGDLKPKIKHELRDHQREALEAVHQAMVEGEAVRGKLIMSCGTGKTFTSLEIARDLTGNDGTVLFLAPSISLISQSMREWISESKTPIYPIVICSDTQASKSAEDLSTADLIHPATTNPEAVLRQYDDIKERQGMKVIFSTYQSIEVVEKFQKLSSVVFDLIINDEAHRTTGATLIQNDKKKESYFLITHNNDRIPAKKRLYMTATPKIYGEATKAKADDKGAFVSSMDDPEIYGEELYRISFAESIKRGLLTDYKVQVIAVDEGFLDRKMRGLIDDKAEKGQEITLDDLTRIYGIWTGLSKKSNDENEYINDPDPMRRAIIYTNRIKDSKLLMELFKEVVERYGDDESLNLVNINIDHSDGSMDSMTRAAQLDWLRNGSEDECRILTNAKCLSEGIDVPALDAVAFANPRSSLIDIIQSVGRAMRRDPAGKKKYGYVIIPIIIPSESDPATVLDESRYNIIWNVLRALRTHDERLNAKINQLALDKKHGKAGSLFAVGSESGPQDGPNIDVVVVNEDGITPIQGSLDFGELERWQDSIFAKLVLKLGDSKYWETWARDVGNIAQRFITRITNLLEENDPAVKRTFEEFLRSLQSNLNKSTTEEDAKEMLAQHLITKPVFEALFKDYNFTANNPVSKDLDAVIDVLLSHGFDGELESMKGFYTSVEERIKDLTTAESRQQVIKDLYESFFRIAFKKQAEKLGIAYTPNEIVDFIIRSIEWLLNKEFNSSLADEGVEIIDPFSGTGTFMVRLLQLGILPKERERLMYKYQNEMHANEILLLAYYISTINIEETFHSIFGHDAYVKFPGMVLADTFQMAENPQQVLEGTALEENSERIADQKKRRIQIVMSNPPYSIGQKSQNDNNQNVKYEHLDAAIEKNYAQSSKAGLKRGLYDSYIKAFRWATDRLPKAGKGIIGFVTNGAYIDNAGMDGFRKSLVNEFTEVYVFNLRGNQRTSGETSRKEGGKIFGSGSRAPIAITLLLRNPERESSGKVHYYDIGDYHSREDKLKIISEFKDGSNIEWKIISPDSNNDWVNLRNEEFAQFIPLGSKKTQEESVFDDRYSLGVITSRDAWCLNSSEEKTKSNIFKLIQTYESERKKYHLNPSGEFKDVVTSNPEKISWSRSLINQGKKNKKIEFEDSKVVESTYRPFRKQHFYFDSQLTEMVYQQPQIFAKDKKNYAIQTTGIGAGKAFSALMVSSVPNLHTLDTGQTFPFYWYGKESGPLAEAASNEAISDWYLNKTRFVYQDDSISKEDIFYYIYGILHSMEYRKRFASDLKKELPRIPFVRDFWEFSKAGHRLADLHLNYESVESYPELLEESPIFSDENTFRVEKMKFAGKRPNLDKSTIIYNSYIRISGIPEKAYEYVVNGRSAIDWIMEQYQIKIDSASGIVNDPNDWSDEVGNPRYIIDLLKSIVNVSVQTVDIVNALPPLDVLEVE